MPTATYEKIQTITLTSSGALDFTTIPNTYTDIVMTGQLRAAAGSTVENCWWRYNNDGGANYGSMRGLFYTGGFLSSNATAEDACYMGAISGPGVSEWFYTPFIAHINNYASTSHYRSYLVSYITQTYEANYRMGNWLNLASAVSRITFGCGGNGTFAAGSTVTLWGIKAAV